MLSLPPSLSLFLFGSAAIGVDEECEPCVRFYREGLSVSFMKILTDEAVNSWKYNIHYCILNSCGKLLQLCALHMKRDNPYLLELLAVVLDTDNKFNTFNLTRHSDQYTYVTEPVVSNAINSTAATAGGGGGDSLRTSNSIQTGLHLNGSTSGGNAIAPQTTAAAATPPGHWGILDEGKIYAKSPADPHSPRGWLVDLINRYVFQSRIHYLCQL